MTFAVRNLNSRLVYPPDFVEIIVPIEYDNKQLWNEVEHDIENYQGRGLRYPPKLKADVDNINRGLENSHIMRKQISIIVLLCIKNQKTKHNTNGTHENFLPS